MPKIISVALITQEQMNINTAFDFICMVGESMTEEQVICIISPQRARKEIAKREAIGVAAKENSESILFIRGGVRFVPGTLNRLVSANKDVIGCRTTAESDKLTSDLLMVKLAVFEKIQKPYFGTGHIQGTIDTQPDYYKFFRSCGEIGAEVFTEERLTADNLALKPTGENGVYANVHRIEGESQTGEVIAISIPSPDLIYTHTVSDIAQLVATNKRLFRAIVIINIQSDEIETARNISVEVARQQKASKIFFIDSDMRVPKTLLAKMIKSEKEIIGINATKRDGKGQPIFRKNILGKPFSYKKAGIEQVSFIGMGATMIDMKVFDKIEKPWFYPNYQVGSDEWRGEDYTFCWEARQKGFRIWCDVGLSKEIGHIGAQAYYLRTK